jgi:hypothetical protein
MSEKNRLNAILMEAAKHAGKIVLFRNNTGKAWAGKLVDSFKSRGAQTITLENARPLNAGLVVGGSDLIGWTTVEVTPEMVGRKIAVFTAIEDKGSKTSTSDGQVNFISRVLDAGGIAGIARSADDAINLTNNF